MNVRKLIQRRIRERRGGVDVVGDVNAAISANVAERGGSSHVSSRQTVVQRGGETTVRTKSATEGGSAQDDASRA